MRFKNYLLEDEKVNIFRSLQIKLVDTNTKYNQIVTFVKEKHNLPLDVESLLLKFNSSLKEIYKGKYKFGLCLNEGIIPNDLKKTSSKQIKEIKKEWYRVNDEFAKMQKVLEKHLQDSVEGEK